MKEPSEQDLRIVSALANLGAKSIVDGGKLDVHVRKVLDCMFKATETPDVEMRLTYGSQAEWICMSMKAIEIAERQFGGKAKVMEKLSGFSGVSIEFPNGSAVVMRYAI